MNKRQLLKLLEPFDDDTEIVNKIPLGDITHKSLSYVIPIKCERIGGFFQESQSKDAKLCVRIY